MEQKIRRDRNMDDNLRRLRGEAGLSQEKLCAELHAVAATSVAAPIPSMKPAN